MIQRPKSASKGHVLQIVETEDLIGGVSLVIRFPLIPPSVQTSYRTLNAQFHKVNSYISCTALHTNFNGTYAVIDVLWGTMNA